MAVDWKKLAMDAILADGKVDATEVKILKKGLAGAGGKIEGDAVQFLVALRAAAAKKAKASGQKLSPDFEKFFSKTISDNVLKEGKIDASQTKWLRDTLFPAGKVDAGHYRLFADLNKKAKEKHPDWEALHKEVQSKHAKASKGK
jgi:hypothetical protein